MVAMSDAPHEGPMTIGDLTGDDVVSLDPGASLVDVATSLVGADIGAVVVGSPDDIGGVVSERDIVRAVAKGLDLSATTASEVATTTLVWADAGSSIDAVAEQMMEQWVRHVLIEQDGRFVGIVSARDVLGVLTSTDDDEG